MIHRSVALEMFQVVRSESNARLLYGLLFKLPICKINKAQSDMCLNMPVVLLCQRASGPDADPWHFRPQAVGGKYYVQNKSEQYSVVLRGIMFGRQVTTANLTTWCLFFNSSILPNKIVAWQATYTSVVEKAFLTAKFRSSGSQF